MVALQVNSAHLSFSADSDTVFSVDLRGYVTKCMIRYASVWGGERIMDGG